MQYIYPKDRNVNENTYKKGDYMVDHVKSKVVSSIKNGILGDVVFKMLANVISIIIRNIMVLPILAMMFSKGEYGELITVIGVITTISAGLGNSLLSTRLIMDSDYRKWHIQGDFNFICILVSILSMFFVFIISFLFPEIGVFQLIIISLILSLETFCGYHSGWFILRQAYKKLLMYTIIGGFGFVFGLFLSYLTNLWSFTYLISDFFCFIFLVYKSPLVKEKKRITKKYKITLKKYFVLILTTVISNALAYLDRLLLYPIIGSEAVAIYTTASMFGKAFNLVALPVSSIMLGYYATERIKLDLRKFWIINLTTILILIIFIIITRIAGVWFTGLLYPNIVDDAAPFVLIANLSSAVGASAQITKSAALKYSRTQWLLVIQIIYAFIYVGFGYIGVLNYGLTGFSYTVLFANIIQLLLLYVVCHLSMKKKL